MQTIFEPRNDCLSQFSAARNLKLMSFNKGFFFLPLDTNPFCLYTQHTVSETHKELMYGQGPGRERLTMETTLPAVRTQVTFLTSSLLQTIIHPSLSSSCISQHVNVGLPL